MFEAKLSDLRQNLSSILEGNAIHCPHMKCDAPEFTHIVDVVWEADPVEFDRRWVRLEMRCEYGHGTMILVRNHGGFSRVEYQLLGGDPISPFAEGNRW
jgi:hypothetical protein